MPSQKKIALLFIGLGLLINPFTVELWFVPDHKIESIKILLGILFSEFLLFLTGIIIFLLPNRIDNKSNKCGLFSFSKAELILCIVSLFATYVCIEIFFGIAKHYSALTSPTLILEKNESLAESDDVLGFKPKANMNQEVTYLRKKKPVYRAKYTTDEFARRTTVAPETSNKAQKFALFFGGSFTFGEGLNDYETLPSKVATELPGLSVYNYGYSGYGPQMMLAKIQRGNLESEVSEKEGVLVYVFIEDHIRRAIVSSSIVGWGGSYPYYEWRKNGLEYRGLYGDLFPIKSFFLRLIYRSNILRFSGLDYPEFDDKKHSQMVARMISKSKSEFLKKYPDSHFYVLIYPQGGATQFSSINNFLEQYDVDILNYFDDFSIADEGMGMGDSMHPSAKANEIVAKKFARDLIKKHGSEYFS